MTTPHSTSHTGRGLRLLLVLVLPAALLLAGCDSGGSTPPTTPPNTPGNSFANYDTTTVAGQQRIIFKERGNQDGVVPATEAPDDQNTRGNYVKWTNDYTYIIDGRTFVNENDTLEIEPGTVIKGEPNQDPDNASVLVVAKGGTILADGNPGSDNAAEANPIIFTAKEDDVSDPNDLGPDFDAAWGGVILLGNGPKNFPGARNVEGIPTDVTRARFGSSNSDPNDDTGVFRFVSIRYGGISIGAGNEINALTLGAIGSGTTVEYVESFNNLDDGMEWFGGNVDVNHLVASHVGDDSFDIDQGFNGSLQFVLAIQSPTRGDRTGEHDSGDTGYGDQGEGDQPVARPPIANATYLGSGGIDGNGDGMPDGGGDITLKLRDNWGGKYYNSIFYDFPTYAVEFEDVAGTKVDTRNQWDNGNGSLTIENNTFYRYWNYDQASSNQWTGLVELTRDANGTATMDDSTQYRQNIADYLAQNNTYGDPGIERPQAGGDVTTLVPPAGNAAATAPTSNLPSGHGFQNVSYRGAFEPGGTNWASWTFSAERGIIPAN